MVAEGVEEVKEQSAHGNDDAFDEEWQQCLEAGELTLDGQPGAEVPTILYQQPLAQEKEDAQDAKGQEAQKEDYAKAQAAAPVQSEAPAREEARRFGARGY